MPDVENPPVQPELREPASPAREAPPGAVGASPNAVWKVWARNLGVSAAAGVFLSLIGALGTDALPLLQRLLYWVPLMLGGALVADLVARVVNRIPRAGASPWLYGALFSLVLSVPVTVIVWLHSSLMFQQPLVVWHMTYQYAPVLVISAAMTAIMMLMNQPGRVTHAPPADSPTQTVRFMDRLPPKLKGAVIYAVSSEDHYLRLHTSKGSDLILMRLSDAISELEGFEGAQTHRSWWVAKDAVEEMRRDGDRVTLLLKGGAQAPVSRPNVRPLREAGWF